MIAQKVFKMIWNWGWRVRILHRSFFSLNIFTFRFFLLMVNFSTPIINCKISICQGLRISGYSIQNCMFSLSRFKFKFFLLEKNLIIIKIWFGENWFW